MDEFTESRKIQAGPLEITLEKTPDNFVVLLSWIQQGDGLLMIHLKLVSQQAAVPGPYRLSWQVPMVDIHGFWRPGTDRSRTLPADWSEPFVSQSTTHAPAGCLYNLNGQNRHTWAFSDALNPIEIQAGVHEEKATFLFSLTLFRVNAPFKEYEALLRLDTRDRHYFESLQEVSDWWTGQPAEMAQWLGYPIYTPARVPEVARQPMYSTWYSFHQRLLASEVEEQCRLAAPLGCTALIVDDGWQTANNDRGYAYCGDWEVYTEKIPDMRAHVTNIHDLGQKFILWYALPFVGEHSRAFERFQGKFLRYNKGLTTWVLDPRFAEVREYLINIFETAVQEWGVDGFKIDFVQDFKQPPGEALTEEDSGGRDCLSVPEATDRLLTEISQHLVKINPEMLIEFRQPYIGPLMRKYGNMFRAGDCPNDSLSNRVRTIDVRLLAGHSATHSDMLMWHPAEPVESAALQLVNILFSVPQISVRLDQLPPDHHQMLAFWLEFWTENKELLLDGELRPWQPEMWYPVVETLNEGEQLIAVYAVVVARPSGPLRDKITLINGTLQTGVVLDFGEEFGRCSLEIKDCMGQQVSYEQRFFPAGLVSIPVPPAGLAAIIQI